MLVEDVWQRLMDKAHQARFSDLTVVVPCCGEAASLNDLAYELPCGFASYVLEARNPGRRLAGHELGGLAAELGCAIREIWAHL